MIQRLVKRLNFNEQARPQVVLSDTSKIRLNNDDPEAVALTLAFPFTEELDAVGRSPETTPQALTSLLGFDVEATVPTGTSVGYRLRFGPGGAAGVLYWDGSAWSPATTDAHWNTAQEVNDNLPALTSLPSRTLAVDVNLRSDGSATPAVRSVCFLANFAIEWWDDLIYDTVVRSLRNTLRATTDISFEIATDTASLDLTTTYKLDADGYNFTAVVSAYDLTTDPNRLTNLAAGYTPGAARPDGTNAPGSIQLTTSVPAGRLVRVTLEHAPEIAVNTHQDYYEPARLPCVVFERIFQVPTADGSSRGHDTGNEGEVYKNRAAFTGVLVPSPRQFACRFDYAVFAQSSADEARILTAMESWVANHRFLRAWGIDEGFRVDWDRGADRSGGVNADDVRTSTGAFMLRGVQFWLREAVDVALVQNFNVDLASVPPEVTEP